MPAQQISTEEILAHKITDRYGVFVNAEGKVSFWSHEMMVYKMFEF